MMKAEIKITGEDLLQALITLGEEHARYKRALLDVRSAMFYNYVCTCPHGKKGKGSCNHTAQMNLLVGVVDRALDDGTDE